MICGLPSMSVEIGVITLSHPSSTTTIPRPSHTPTTNGHPHTRMETLHHDSAPSLHEYVSTHNTCHILVNHSSSSPLAPLVPCCVNDSSITHLVNIKRCSICETSTHADLPRRKKMRGVTRDCARHKLNPVKNPHSRFIL